MKKKNRLTSQNILELLNDYKFDVFIETGTYRAVTTLQMSEVFEEVHSIELSEILYKEAINKCKSIKNIHLYYGNSVDILPLLDIDKPVCFFLDAHACKTKPPVCIHGKFPLWEELEFICDRPHKDLIIIDDTHCFGEFDGRTGTPEWEGVTEESIINFIEKHKSISRCFEFNGTYVVYV